MFLAFRHIVIAHGRLWIAGAVTMVLLPALVCCANADSSKMAPAGALSATVGAGYESLDDVYYGMDVPEDRPIQIQAALFNEDGYQLFDKAGETVNVPYIKDDLYTMQFAVAAGRVIYFENVDAHPVLYVPKDGYLTGVPPDYGPVTGPYSADNAGGRWYPFSKDFSPSEPVYMGPAPTWAAYLNMPWYPGVRIEGGYWSDRPVGRGVAVAPTTGLLFAIDGHIYSDWAGFMSYAMLHPTPSRGDANNSGMGGGHGGGHGR